MSNIVNIENDTWNNEVLQAPELVLVDFYAPWCGPSRMIGPAIEKLANEYSGKIKIAKVNVDECKGLARSYDIAMTPTLLFFKHEQQVDRVIGAGTEQQLRDKINKLISN